MRREAAAYAGVELNRFGSAAWNFIRVLFLVAPDFTVLMGDISTQRVFGSCFLTVF
jgi:hypothetical protein